MPPISEKNQFIIALSVFAVLLVIVVYIRFEAGVLKTAQPVVSTVSQATPLPQSVNSGVGADIYDKASSPTNSIPQTNPFNTSTNPISDAYQNPFE